jgi:hypothetical protein
MNEELWAGVELKLQHAEFHLHRMGESLEPPERTGTNVAMQAPGAIIDTGWQRSFYAHLDAFLSAARSVPEIIQCCFGVDEGHSEMRTCFKRLPEAERLRRQEFKKQFKGSYESFRALRLGTVRHISEHRTGVAPVKVTISGMFGVTYIGGPVTRVPIAETRHIDDSSLLWMAKPIPLPQPSWDDFDIEGQPLFPACQDYLNGARALVNDARHVSNAVHGTIALSSPPS